MGRVPRINLFLVCYRVHFWMKISKSNIHLSRQKLNIVKYWSSNSEIWWDNAGEVLRAFGGILVMYIFFVFSLITNIYSAIECVNVLLTKVSSIIVLNSKDCECSVLWVHQIDKCSSMYWEVTMMDSFLLLPYVVDAKLLPWFCWFCARLVNPCSAS